MELRLRPVSRFTRSSRSVKARLLGTPIAFILDSLKHPDEVAALQKVYASSFYLVSILCTRETRLKRLRKKHKDSNDDEINALMDRDEAGEIDEGQQVRKTWHLADFFVHNEEEDVTVLAAELGRFLNITLRKAIHRPERDEIGMYTAASAALRSSCLSRYVGAALLSANGDVIATGTNEVPKFGGGLYDDKDEEKGTDHRCFKDGAYCRNDRTKGEILAEIYEALGKAELLSENATEEKLIAALGPTRVKALIEFSRAVHAEMASIVSVARQGGVSVEGATLYTTTYPCHVCARHIIAAGIKEVVYIEPYPKSLAVDLHGDAISPTGEANHVHFREFAGVAPRRFEQLFKQREAMKNKQGLLAIGKSKDASHVDPVYKKSFLALEEDIAKAVKERLVALQSKASG